MGVRKRFDSNQIARQSLHGPRELERMGSPVHVEGVCCGPVKAQVHLRHPHVVGSIRLVAFHFYAVSRRGRNRSWISDLGFGIWDLGYGIRDLGYGIWDIRFGGSDFGFGTWILERGMFSARSFKPFTIVSLLTLLPSDGSHPHRTIPPSRTRSGAGSSRPRGR